VIASVGSEMICRIALEYMAMGIPVVGADTNVIPEIIRHDQTGLIVPKGNPEAMASAMEFFAASRDRAAAFGRAGRSLAEREFSLERFAQKTLDAYRKMAIDA
jgi:glycosyltransferase involved in cell wall biosynthesis